jgi:dTDP-glucose 4,6-dehydratase
MIRTADYIVERQAEYGVEHVFMVEGAVAIAVGSRARSIGNFIRDAMKGVPIKVKDGTPYRSYLYAADLAVWLWIILFQGKACHPYNVGSDQEITIAGLTKTVASIFNNSIKIHSTSTPDPRSPVSRYVPSVGRAESEMGLRVLVPLNQSILRMAAWHRHK